MSESHRELMSTPMGRRVLGYMEEVRKLRGGHFRTGFLLGFPVVTVGAEGAVINSARAGNGHDASEDAQGRMAWDEGCQEWEQEERRG